MAAKILAIRLARLGDIVLLLPSLTLLKSFFPESQITFLTDKRLVPLATMCPAIDDIIAVDRIAMRDGARLASARGMFDVIRDVRDRRFDLVIDFHGFRETNVLTWLSGARQRIGLKLFGRSFWKFCFNLPPVLEDKNIHEAEVFLRVVHRFGAGLPTPTPTLEVPEDCRHWARESLPKGSYAGLFVDAPTPLRIWPAERFAALADYLAGSLGLEVVAISGPDGSALVNRIKAATKFPDKIHGFSNLTIPQLAAVVQSAGIWISNDTGPLHLGPALNVPTLGLFSIGLPEHFRPTGTTDKFILGNPIDQISVDAVIGRVGELWSTARRDLRH